MSLKKIFSERKWRFNVFVVVVVVICNNPKAKKRVELMKAFK